MKFGKQIRFVAVKDWWDHYVPYKHYKEVLKGGLSSLQKSQESGKSKEELESMTTDIINSFLESLKSTVSAVTGFYVEKYNKSKKSIDDINVEIEDRTNETGLVAEADHSLLKRVHGEAILLYELHTFIGVNRSACQKLIKKVAKQTHRPEVKQMFTDAEAQLFGNLPEIDDLMRILDDQYVTIKRNFETDKDTRSRPDIIAEFHTSIEKSLEWKQNTVLTQFDAVHFWRTEMSSTKAPLKPIPTAIAILFLLSFQFKQFSTKFDFPAQRCVGIVGFASILWATGAVPLWLTSLCIPLLAVVCNILPTVSSVGKAIEQGTMSYVVWLTMGGFTIAAALRETELDKRIATIILRKASTSPRLFLLVLSVLNIFIAMWISNITSTMIVITIAAPTLKMLPRNSNYIKAMLLSIAVGGNLGGMTTPLSSPQNAVTIDAVTSAAEAVSSSTRVSFTEFFATATPFAIICALLAWLIIMWRFPIDIEKVPKINEIKTDFGWRQIVVSIISLATIAVWIALPFGLDSIFSDYGIVGMIPMIAFYAIGILPPTKLAELPWNIIFLLFGGNVLSMIVKQSGLMTTVSSLMTSLLGHQTLWVTILIVDLCVIVIDFFLTHTVSSMITMPIVATFAASTGHLALYCMSACMTTTASQILPVSSFPNMCTSSLQDENKKEYILPSDIIKWGILITVVCFACVMSIYFGIALAYGM